MLEQSSTGRTYTRDAYAPVRRDAHAQVEELTGVSLPAPFHFSNFAKSVLDRSEFAGTVHYIEQQLEHYRTRTFQEEYLAFLQKHGAHFDEKYLWD